MASDDFTGLVDDGSTEPINDDFTGLTRGGLDYRVVPMSGSSLITCSRPFNSDEQFF